MMITPVSQLTSTFEKEQALKEMKKQQNMAYTTKSDHLPFYELIQNIMLKIAGSPIKPPVVMSITEKYFYIN